MAVNPIQELQAMMGGGGGGGGGGGMPPGTPPAMGAAMGQRSGGIEQLLGGGGGGMMQMIGPMISQFLGQLMSNPQAMSAIGGALSDMAGPQNAPGGMQLASANPQDMRQYQATQTGLPPGPEAAGAPMGDQDIPAGDEAEEMVAREVDGAGGGEWQGSRAPTAEDVEKLRSDPDGYRESFDAKFGEGACDQYLDESDEEYDEEQPEDDEY